VFIERHGFAGSTKLLAQTDDLYDVGDDHKYFEYLTSAEGIKPSGDSRARLHQTYASTILAARGIHAENYAERVFHDRQLYEHISRSLVLIGFDGKDINDAEPKQWIDRIEWPEWAKKAVRARDRGMCASCGVNIGGELMANEQFDHIVPLSRVGTNDLCNLQLLCDSCNNKKSANQIDVASFGTQVLKRWPPFFVNLERLSFHLISASGSTASTAHIPWS